MCMPMHPHHGEDQQHGKVHHDRLILILTFHINFDNIYQPG